MRRYENGQTATIASAAAAGTAVWELRAAATGPLFLFELHMVTQGVAVVDLALVRPSAQGVTPTSPQNGVATNPAMPASAGQTAVAWGTAPTNMNTNQPMRRSGVPGSGGAGVIWVWPPDKPLYIPPSASIGLVTKVVQGGTAAALDINSIWEE